MSVLLADFDECSDAATNDGHENSTCMNILGSFACVCQDGFTGNGTLCTGNRKN